MPVFAADSEGKASAYNAGGPGSMPGSGRSPGEGNGSPLQDSRLENPRDRGAWQATVLWVAKNTTERLHYAMLTWKPYYLWKWEEGFPGVPSGKESACPCRRCSSIPGWRRSPGVGNSNPLQDSCMEKKSMDRGAWWATSDHAVTELDMTEWLTHTAHKLKDSSILPHTHVTKKDHAPWKESYDQPRQHTKKQTLLCQQRSA